MDHLIDDSDRLKPCPFCGGEAEAGCIDTETQDHPDEGGRFISCATCGASTGLRFACGEDPMPLLVEQWNRRAAKAHTESLAGAVLDLNRLWNTSGDEAAIAAQLDLCLRLAKYTPTAREREDAARFRWLTEDHADAETRAKCRELLGRMGVMSYSAACTDIDSAMAADLKRSMLRTVDAHVAARKEA